MPIEYLAFPAFIGFIYLASIYYWPRIVAMICLNVGLLALSGVLWIIFVEGQTHLVNLLFAFVSSAVWIVVSWSFYLWFQVKFEAGEFFRPWNAR